VLATADSADPEFVLERSEEQGVVVDRVAVSLRRTDPDGMALRLPEWRAHEASVAAFLEKYLERERPDLVGYSATRPLGEECLLTVARLGIPAVAILHEAWLICPRVMLLRSPDSASCPGPAPGRCGLCMYSQYEGLPLALARLPWRILKIRGYYRYRLRRRLAARRTLRGALGYSRFITDRHAPHIPGPVRHIPLGINLAGRPSERPVRPRMPLRFGFIGGSQPNKGLSLLLGAVGALRREGLAFELHLWGPDQRAAGAEVARSGLGDRVRLRGTYGPADLWGVYAEMDVAVMATLVSEPFGRVPQEAAAMGAISIVPAVGGLTEQIRDGVDGLLFRFRDADHLTRQMRRVLTEPDLLPRLMANLWEVPDTRVQAARVEAFYDEVLGQSPEGQQP